MARNDPWRLDGPDTRPERPALADALRRLHSGRRGPVPDTYEVPVSTFPMTAAARHAVKLNREV